MILEALINVFCNFIMSLFDTLNFIALPLDVLEVLQTFMVYGGYVVGNDLLILFGSVVFFWATAKLSVGLGIRIWEMLPFT